MDYKFIEELTMNNWQALSTLLVDGWVLRFADGYSKRANSINPIYPSTGSLTQKIEECQRLYQSQQLPATYKITPFVQPSHLDQTLEGMGYSMVDRTSVQVLQLGSIREPQPVSFTIYETLHHDWLESFCRINRVSGPNRPIMERMLSNIKTRKGFITLFHDGHAVACGLGVMERGYIGLHDIVTDVDYRNRGFAEQMILSLLKWGKENGASHSYLAVVENNAPAQRLYSKMGFSEIYSYWYRVKPLLQQPHI